MRTSSIRASGGSKAKGFTLIELVVAISIASLVVGLGVPAMWRLYQSSTYRESLREAHIAANSARYRAITSGVTQDLVFRIDPAGYAVRDVGTRLDSDAFHAFAAPVSISAVVAREVSADRRFPAIRFYADGSSSGGTVTITNAREGARMEGVRIGVSWLHGRVSREPL